MELLLLCIRAGFWDLIGGGKAFKRGDFAHGSFYLLEDGVMQRSVPGAAQSRQQARKSSIPSGEERCREMLSLAEMKSTEPRCRDISEAAAVDVPTAVPWITSRMLAESMAETRYSLMEAGICQGKRHRGHSVPQLSWLGWSPFPPFAVPAAAQAQGPQLGRGHPKPPRGSGSASAQSCWRS